MTSEPYEEPVLMALLSAANRMGPSSGRDMITAWLYLACSFADTILSCITAAQMRTLMEGMGGPLRWLQSFIALPNRPEETDAWLDFFDWLGRSALLGLVFHSRVGTSTARDDTWPDTLQADFIKRNSGGVGLLRLLGRLAAAGRAIELVPPARLDLDLFSEPRTKLAAILVRLSQAGPGRDELIDLADKAASLLSPLAEPGADSLVFRTAESHLKGNPNIEHFLLRLWERMPAELAFGRANCERLLRQCVRRRASDLQTSGALERPALPVACAPAQQGGR